MASDRFQKAGYHATSMHDIMQLAGVPGGSLYYHFPTKKSLGLAVIREAVAQSIAETWIAPLRTCKSAKAGILKAFESVADQIERDGRGVTGCPLNNLTIELSLADKDFQSALRDVFDSWTSAIAARIREDIRGGKLRGIEPAETAVAVVASFSGAMALAKAVQDAQPIRTCARKIGFLFAPASAKTSRRLSH
ncbi:MAG TPA: TetR/AcrR family transcriptional regulator [Candidatus Baltobacteraceae bacterium]|nr:TetR/AcrR family transcriptional regulator [Candidatus Baltobacteraceae bacterium]